jgi:VWFA-related protein
MPTLRSARYVFPLLAASFLPVLAAQTNPAPATSPHTDAKVLTLAVTVRDKHGKLIPNLTKNDFTLIQDGRPQTINDIKTSAGLPLTFGLLVQIGMNQSDTMAAERTATQRFSDQMLATDLDNAFLIQFDREVDLLADLTSNKGKLHSALDQLGSPQFNYTGNPQASDESSHRLGGSGTVLYDSIYLASNEVMKKQPGRKVLVILTDGVDRGSKESLFSAIEAAQRANTTVYAIYLKGQERYSVGNNDGYPGRRRGGNGAGYPGGGYPGGGGGGGYPGGGGGYPGNGSGWPGSGNGGGNPTGRPTEGSRIDGRKVLEQICSETGGYMFEANKKQSVDQAYSAIAQELGAQYIVSYTPDKQSAGSSGYQRIVLTAKKKGLYVQTRQGYYGRE